MPTERAIVIGGGVGPMAGVALHARIIENTLTDGTDQSHLDVLHFSRSRDIADRSDYLGGRIGENPAEGMLRTFAMAQAGLAVDGREAVGGVPCNTFHAPAVFGAFVRALADSGIGIEIVDMLAETLALIEARAPRARAIGLLSTTGTRESRVYDRLLENAGLRPVYVHEGDQARLHDAIYDRIWGLKAKSPATDRAIGEVRALAEKLVERGADAVVLACTELPLALSGMFFREIPLVDPVLALARALVREAAPGKLKPLE